MAVGRRESVLDVGAERDAVWASEPDRDSVGIVETVGGRVDDLNDLVNVGLTSVAELVTGGVTVAGCVGVNA